LGIIDDEFIERLEIEEQLDPLTSAEYQFSTPLDFSILGDYDIRTIVTHPEDGYSANDTLEVVLSKINLLEAELSIVEGIAKCGNEIDIIANIKNNGEATFYSTKIEVISNGMIVDVVDYNFNIPYLIDVDFTISVTDNLQSEGNEITLNLISVNNEPDAVVSNNTATYSADLDSRFDFVALTINPDNYPSETSWVMYDEQAEEIVSFGDLPNGNTYTEDICVDYSSCLTFTLMDSFGDGICCSYGMGNFSMTDSSGEELFYNDGDFNTEASEFICPNKEGCAFTSNFNIEETSSENANDGSITINPVGGYGPFEYSINGGASFSNSNTFSNLPIGDYDIVIRDDAEICSYDETVTVNFDILDDVNELYDGQIKVYPNPTNANLIVEIQETFEISGDVQLEVYDFLGRLLQSSKVLRNGQETKTVISLDEYTPGSYVVKCYNTQFEKHFKVIKI